MTTGQPNTRNNLGVHLLAELKGCDAAVLDSEAEICTALADAAETIGAQVIGVISRKFQPQGVTVVIAISESHLSIHTWPEHRYAAVDIFTCGDLSSLSAAMQTLASELGAQCVTTTRIARGVGL